MGGGEDGGGTDTTEGDSIARYARNGPLYRGVNSLRRIGARARALPRTPAGSCKFPKSIPRSRQWQTRARICRIVAQSYIAPNYCIIHTPHECLNARPVFARARECIYPFTLGLPNRSEYLRAVENELELASTLTAQPAVYAKILNTARSNYEAITGVSTTVPVYGRRLMCTRAHCAFFLIISRRGRAARYAWM